MARIFYCSLVWSFFFTFAVFVYDHRVPNIPCTTKHGRENETLVAYYELVAALRLWYIVNIFLRVDDDFSFSQTEDEDNNDNTLKARGALD